MAANRPYVNDRTSTADRRNTAAVQSNRQIALQHLCTHYNFNQHQVSAVMASLQHESNFQLSAKGDAGTAHGLFQWRHNRHTNMQRFTAARKDQNPVTAQIDFAMHEMGIARKDNSNVSGPSFCSERSAGNALKNATTTSQAVHAMKQFERYDDRRNETGRRHQTALGFLGEVASVIGRGIAEVGRFVVNGVRAIGEGIGKVFSNIFHPTPSAPRHPHAYMQGGAQYNQFSQSMPHGPHQRVDAVIGDSIGKGQQACYAPNVQNLAVVGAHINQAQTQLSRLAPGSVADVYLGSNHHGDSPEHIRRQTQEFLRTAQRHNVQIRNWVLPGEAHGQYANVDKGLERAANVISREVQAFNAQHPHMRPIQAVEMRGQNIALNDGLHPAHPSQVMKAVERQTAPMERPHYVAHAPTPAMPSKAVSSWKDYLPQNQPRGRA